MPRRAAKGPDKILLIIILIWFLAGIIILTSASSFLSQIEFGYPYFFIKHQLLYGGILGLVLGLISYKISYKFWKKISAPLFIFSILLLVLVFMPQLSYGSGGAQRWIKLSSFSIQPSEIVKLSFIIYLSAWLAGREKKMVRSIKLGIFPFLASLAVLGFLLAIQPDIGTLGIIVLTAFLLFFLGGGSITHIVILIALGGIMAWKIIEVAPYRLARLKTFLDPAIDPLGISYQVNQALIAIGSGGILGLGLSQSRQKFNYLPEPIGDSIFAIFAEEAGFIGASAIIILVILFIWRGIKISKGAPDKFSSLLAAGIVGWVGFQSFVNIASISGLMPLTGLPLPLISYGGTALAVTLWASGILLNISKYTV